MTRLLDPDELNGGDFDGHVPGDEDCAACWSHTPDLCEDDPECYIHTEFGDENRDGDYWLQKRHDRERGS